MEVNWARNLCGSEFSIFDNGIYIGRVILIGIHRLYSSLRKEKIIYIFYLYLNSFFFIFTYNRYTTNIPILTLLDIDKIINN